MSSERNNLDQSNTSNNSNQNNPQINSNQPTDIIEWITHESKQLGYDFTSLTRKQQHHIISTIMSGLENGFRSRCNYPDLRFARRRGIGLRAQPSEYPNQNNLSESQNIKSSDSECTYYQNCIDTEVGGVKCIDSLCQNDNDCRDSGCIDNPCINNKDCEDTDCTDEICTNSNDCIDNIPCLDDYCLNKTDECKDYTSTCVDNNCTNETNCVDTAGTTQLHCIDGATCTNNIKCIDYKCEDNTCTNRNECADNVTPSRNCIDSACNNEKNCADSGLSTYCLDNSCDNTGIGTVNCADTGDNATKCIDNGCINDTYADILCEDKDCQNDKSCVDNLGVCQDSNCLNYGRNSCIDNLNCTDKPYYNEGPINANNCLDTECKDNACYNNTKTVQTCQDQHHCRDQQCVNIGTSECSDSSQCYDQPGCYNTECIDSGMLGLNCSDNSCRNLVCDKNFLDTNCLYGVLDQAPFTAEQCHIGNNAINNIASCSIDTPECTDTATECRKTDLQNTLAACVDIGRGGSGNGCTDNECVNSHNCVDNKHSDGYKYIDTGCINSENCGDYNDCLDDGCHNANLCTDESGCEDQHDLETDEATKCLNQYCLDIGSTSGESSCQEGGSIDCVCRKYPPD